MRSIPTFLLLVALIPPHLARAQTDTPTERLIYGDSVTRDFSADVTAFVFSFYAQKGDSVTITLVAVPDLSIDPALTLIAPDGQAIAQNDDSLDEKFGLTNARLVNFPIPASGMYLIKATRDSTATPTGTFTLILKGRRGGEARGSIDFGAAAQGKISNGTPTISYEFRALRGDVLSAEVKNAANSSLAPTISLLDPANTQIAAAATSAKDAGVASLNRTLITEDGVYTIIVSRAGGDKGTTNGDFQLSLTRNLHGALLNYGDSSDGTITADAPETRYVFQGNANDIVTITMLKTSGTLDPYLALLSPDNRTLVANDNGTGTGLKRGDARIAKFRIPAAGVYVIVAGRAGRTKGTSTGAYTIMLDATVPKGAS